MFGFREEQGILIEIVLFDFRLAILNENINVGNALLKKLVLFCDNAINLDF